MITKKHFKAIADIIKSVNMPDEVRADLIKEFCVYFRGENPNFRAEQFKDASGFIDIESREVRADLIRKYGE